MLNNNSSFTGITQLIPNGNGTRDLGSASNRWNLVYAANGTIQTSGKNLIKNIDALPYGLAQVMRMKPVSFNWKTENDKDTKHLGFIAQEIQTKYLR